MNPDRILPFSELPAEADMDKPEWSFSHGGSGGVIHHCAANGHLTDYPIPLVVQQLVSRCSLVSEAKSKRLQKVINSIYSQASAHAER